MDKPLGKASEKELGKETNSTQMDSANKATLNKRRKKPIKPEGFKEFESLAKGIIEADGASYYQWLHEQHQEIILNFNVKNHEQVTEVAKKGE